MPLVPTEYPGKELEAMSFAVNYHRWIVDEIASYLGDMVGEVGAGTGDLSSILLETGISHLHAYEPSPRLYARLREKLTKTENATLVNGFFDRNSCPSHIDSIVYINVLEHIENDLDELREVYGALGPEGRLIIFVPALSWLFSKADREMGHFRRYSKPGLADLVEQCGFTIEMVRYFDMAGVIPWFLNFVLLKNSFNARSVSLYDRLVVPPMRRLEKILTPPIGKNVLLVAKKP